MFLGYYTPLFYSSVNPWTTLGPLALVISVSLAQEAYTDIKRHVSDKATNNHPCVVLRRADEIDTFNGRTISKKKHRKRDPKVNNGKDLEAKVGITRVPIAFESVSRMNIFAGDIVFVRNREMIPADLILLASSNDGGSAYVETSSIDGETNLKLRNSPHLPAQGPDTLASSSCDSLMDSDSGPESLKHAVQRIANMSLLGHTEGVGAVLNPKNADELPKGGSCQGTRGLATGISARLRQSLFGGSRSRDNDNQQARMIMKEGGMVSYVTTLTSEPPNTHVNNYSGKLTLPPSSPASRSESAPLGAENLLLRGAVLRNTEWVIGVACFTGADTKLVMNSVATPSKFSQLDMLINHTVVLVLIIMIASVCSLGALSTHLNQRKIGTLWYAGISQEPFVPWPYFNLEATSNLAPPQWKTTTPNFFQNTFMFITMLSNFVPLSLYVSVEIITVMMMLYIGWDLNMYHEETDTPASARSTIVTDLGLVQYIFSDKTGTLTCNVMEFKRCSVDGNIFGMPVSKAAPQRKISSNEQNEESQDAEFDSAHPLKRLLTAGASLNTAENSDQYASAKLTFNAEMFLRVMSICHTVVVEKDHAPTDNGSPGASKEIEKTESNVSASSSSMWSPNRRPKAKAKAKKKEKKDGSPEGFVYQAESPDEGALVAAASNEYGFQLLGRDSSGVQISCSCPSLLEDENVVEGLKNGTLTAKILAGKTATNEVGGNDTTVDEGFSPRKETWSILAINKFDSDRKRMSVLVRSPPELGSVPMLFCKGADSSMMVDGVCEGIDLLQNLQISNVETESEVQNAEFSSLLGIEAHLGGKFRCQICQSLCILM
jgi:magnesium-transporting ATPase (P-type)